MKKKKVCKHKREVFTYPDRAMGKSCYDFIVICLKCLEKRYV